MIVFGGISLSFLIGTPTEKFLYVINELQLIFHFPLMQILVPGNILIVFTQLINLVKYDVLNQLRILDWTESIADAQQNEQKAFYNGYWF